MARIVVCGYMIRNPLAGNIFAFFHYVLGLHRLGHDVLYLEESGWPGSCYDPVGRTCGDAPQAGLRVVRGLMAEHGIEIPVCYVNRESGNVDGAAWDDIRRTLAGADLLLNVGGVCWLPEFLLCRRRAIVDMDPLFTQVGRIGVAALENHQIHFSYGVNMGRVGCTVPTVGINWIPTVPPVVLELWEGAHVPADAPFTTTTNWSSYGAVTYRGEHYGQKDEELLRLLHLPTRSSQRLELALAGVGPEVTKSLRRAGWLVRNAGEVSSDLATYQAYVTGSRGEVSAAKHAYVKTHSGWFSDRSVCYLAAGLPVVLQDTGFGDWLPIGQGVLAFSSINEAADCIARVSADYMVQRRAAREIAEEYFDARRVLTDLLEHAMDA